MTSKELSFLEDTIKAEQQLVKKYKAYKCASTDMAVTNLCDSLVQKHDAHYKTLLNNLSI